MAASQACTYALELGQEWNGQEDCVHQGDGRNDTRVCQGVPRRRAGVAVLQLVGRDGKVEQPQEVKDDTTGVLAEGTAWGEFTVCVVRLQARNVCQWSTHHWRAAR